MTGDAPPEGVAEGAGLERRLGLVQATAANMLGMVGVGPFLTIPLMLTKMGGPHILYAWAIGAILALCDGLVYAQLGAALPGSGGPYLYLREAYQPFRLGRLASFVFIFQTILVAPLSIAGGAVGFADYLGFFWASMTPLQHNLVATAVCMGMTALLYRNIESVGRLSVMMLTVVLLTVAWVVVAGLFKFSFAQAFAFPPEAFTLNTKLFGNVGAVALLAMYNYGGYNNVCNIAEEVRDPRKNLPRSILLSIVLVVILYVLISTVILGMVPWTEARHSKTIASLFIQRTFTNPEQGRVAALVMTALILFVTASSLYALILGYSRVPFAAAKDGQFFRAFAKLHPTKHFPHVSLLTLCALALPFCFFSLGELVSWLLLVQIISQFIWQCGAVILLQRFRKDVKQPFRMALFPLPALVALGMWIYVFVTAPLPGILFSLGFVCLAVVAYFIFSRTSVRQPAA